MLASNNHQWCQEHGPLGPWHMTVHLHECHIMWLDLNFSLLFLTNPWYTSISTVGQKITQRCSMFPVNTFYFICGSCKEREDADRTQRINTNEFFCVSNTIRLDEFRDYSHYNVEGPNDTWQINGSFCDKLRCDTVFTEFSWLTNICESILGWMYLIQYSAVPLKRGQFLWKALHRHTVARLFGRGMECILWLRSLIHFGMRSNTQCASQTVGNQTKRSLDWHLDWSLVISSKSINIHSDRAHVFGKLYLYEFGKLCRVFLKTMIIHIHIWLSKKLLPGFTVVHSTIICYWPNADIFHFY